MDNPSDNELLRGRAAGAGAENLPGEETDSGRTESCPSPPPTPPPGEDSWDARSGESVAPKRLGKYQILEQLGRGGMGIVWKARDPDLQRTVAIKVLAPHLAESPVARRRFLREARAAAAISHPNVLTIHSVEEEQETPYLVMEYVSGLSLKEFITRRTMLDFVEVIRLSAQIAQGLAAAHACGVIHRDIKPGNVMLHKGGTRARLTDFGLARAAFDNSELTSADQAVGTPAYMSPEQVRGETVDVRSDLFSLGCLMYALVSRVSPFQGRSSAETVHRILDVTPLPLLTVEPTTPAGYSDVVMKLVAKKPDDRYQSAQEVSEILQRVLVQLNQAPSDQLVQVLSQHLPSSSENAVSTENDKPEPPGRSSWALVGGGLLALLGALLLSSFWKTNGPAPSNPGGAETNSASVGPAVPGGAGAGAGERKPPPFLTQITVGPGPDATCATLAEAVARGTGDCTIRIEGPGPYEEAIVVTGDRITSLTISGAPGVIWRSKNRGEETNALAISGLRRLRIEGVQFEVESPIGRAVHLPGSLSDFAIVNCRFRFAPGEHSLSLINIEGEGAEESARVLIQGCRFEGAMGNGAGISIDAGPRRSPAVEIVDCLFQSPNRHVFASGSCRDLTVRGNVFIDGYAGLMLRYKPWRGEERMEIVNNTFLDVQFWLSWMDSLPADSLPRENRSRLCNNLVLNGQRTLGNAAQWAAVLDTWKVGSNWLEETPRRESGAERDGRLGTVVVSVGAMDRKDPASPKFLVPEAGALLTTGGVGGDLPEYVGAKPPAP